MTIGEKLKVCRTENKFTQADIAKEMHVSRKTISGWETGRNYPDLGSIVRLSEIYHVPLEDLVRDDRMLDHFEEQRKNSLRAEKILRATYWINVVCAILEIIDNLRPNGFHLALIPLVLMINLALLISYFDKWHKFKGVFAIVKIILTFIVLFIIFTPISIMNHDVIQALPHHDAYFISGMMTARLVSAFLLSVSITVIIFFRSPHK